MGKKRENKVEENSDSSPKKTQKQLKKSKQKLPEVEDEIDADESMASTSTASISKQGSASKSGKKKKPNQPQTSQDTDTSDEERWLNAIESGKLEEVDDELKKIKPKDPKLMTARQRAMYEKTSDTKDSSPSKSRRSLPTTTTMIDGVHANVSSSGQLLLALPNFKHKEKEKMPLTAEDLEREKEKAQKRKALADEKREKDKKKTMERLLRKQDSKMVKSTRNRPVKQNVPMISYKNSHDLITLSFPANYECPIKSMTKMEAPKPVVCGIDGCNNLKRYSCSKTNVPLCSFECYSKNILKQLA